MKKNLVLVLFLLLPFSGNTSEPVMDLLEQLGANHTTKMGRKPSSYLAYYMTDEDCIHLRQRSKYKSQACRNHTVLHELGHWARHKSRLGPLPHKYDRKDYYEEIIVDIAAALIADELGFEREDSECMNEYLEGQIPRKGLSKQDCSFIIKEISKTASYILDTDYSEKKAGDFFRSLLG
jgi:antirestriction protein ArdC